MNNMYKSRFSRFIIIAIIGNYYQNYYHNKFNLRNSVLYQDIYSFTRPIYIIYIQTFFFSQFWYLLIFYN